ncbi:MAG: DUF4743 domain-containing protein [Cardiobacteriaceae bacterium]|nr:DUF4743 domain-containing protein [Cardiobacteriaceae bacterium]
MSLKKIFIEANNADPADFLPLFVDNEKVGIIALENREMLADYGFILEKKSNSGQECFVWQAKKTEQENSAFISEITAKMHSDGIITGWRDELYPLSKNYLSPPKALIERAAVPLFGATGFGIHLNGLVRADDEIYMWLGKRSLNKQTSPGKWDQIAAGGLPYGISAFENMQKECAEEAGISTELSRNAYSVGICNYFRRIKLGIRADQMFIYDLWLDENFVPQNIDGEVEKFELRPLRQIIEELRKNTEEIKYNSAIVIVDCALRHGIIPPEDAEYAELCAARYARNFWLKDFSVFY